MNQTRNPLWGRFGVALAIFTVIAPALPFGPLFAQPPMPVAALWLAYGFAVEGGAGWRGALGLFLLGLLHDQLSGGPFGLHAFLYVFAYLVSMVASRAMSGPNLIALWGGFIAASAVMVGVAALTARAAFGEAASIVSFLQATAITAMLFPLVRPLYMARPGASRVARTRQAT